MPINITAKNFDLTDAIRAHVEEKTTTFTRLFDNIIHIDVEVDKETNQHHNKGPFYHVRMNVEIPNELLHAEESREDLYAAIDVCRDEIEQQLHKHKSKLEARHRASRKTRRNLKSILAFWRKEE